MMRVQAKCRALAGFLGWRQNATSTEESVKEFAVRTLGSEVYDKLIEPFMSGVYAGDPSRLSANACLKGIPGM